MIRYKDSVLFLNNSKFDDSVECNYPIILETNDTTHAIKSASYLDLHLELNIRNDQLLELFKKGLLFKIVFVDHL